MSHVFEPEPLDLGEYGLLGWIPPASRAINVVYISIEAADIKRMGEQNRADDRMR